MMINDGSVLFLGTLVPKERQEEVYRKNKDTAQDSGNVFQTKIIRGLEKNLDRPLHICNLLPVGSFPKYYSDIFIPRFTFSHDLGANDINVGYLNFTYIKRLLLPMAYRKELIRCLRTHPDCKAAICYSANLALLSGLKALKRLYPDIVTCLIIPDMPEFNDLSDGKSTIYKWYLNYSSRRFRKMQKYVDCFVYMTEQSADYLNTGKPYIVMEGIAEDNYTPVDLPTLMSGTKTILYTGTTNRQFGIMNLIEAFQLIDREEYRLVICGSGDSDSDIRMATNKDARILHKGSIPHDEVIQLQKEATVLVNPRQNIGEYTKYSFPSKTMEYLTAGIPVVAYKLDGIPNEYDDYIRYVPDNTIQTLSRILREVCDEDSETKYINSCRAQEYVLKSKNAQVQGKRMVELIESVF